LSLDEAEEEEIMVELAGQEKAEEKCQSGAMAKGRACGR